MAFHDRNQLIGNAAREARLKLGLTQRQVQEQTGIVNTTISKIENGRFRGSIQILDLYLNFVGLELFVQPAVRRIPDWDEIEDYFREPDDPQ